MRRKRHGALRARSIAEARGSHRRPAQRDEARGALSRPKRRREIAPGDHCPVKMRRRGGQRCGRKGQKQDEDWNRPRQSPTQVRSFLFEAESGRSTAQRTMDPFRVRLCGSPTSPRHARCRFFPDLDLRAPFASWKRRTERLPDLPCTRGRAPVRGKSRRKKRSVRHEAQRFRFLPRRQTRDGPGVLPAPTFGKMGT